MRKGLAWILLVAVVLVSQPVFAQNPVVIEQLDVDIWPEYDRQDVLVIYHLTLPASTAFPAEVNLRIPAQAGDPYNVAVRNTDGNLYVVEYTRSEQGEWGVVTFRTEQPDIQFEYYDPSLIKNGVGRSFVYRWPGDYAVNNLSIQVQQPVGGSEMQISPSLGAGLTGSDGLVYYSAKVGQVPAGNPFEVSIQYQKADDTLSVQSVKVEPAGPITQETAGRFDFTQYLPWILGALGLILILGGGLWYLQSQRRPQTATSRHRHAAADRVRPVKGGDLDVYCPQCGHRASAGDRFCRTCGTELR